MSKPLFDTTGMKQIEPGCWCDDRDKSLHIDTVLICEHLNIPPTKENCAMLEREAQNVCNELITATGAKPNFETIIHEVKPQE